MGLVPLQEETKLLHAALHLCLLTCEATRRRWSFANQEADCQWSLDLLTP